MIGIYKITSPSNKVYIGQSENIEERFNQYKKLSKKQPRLFNSFKKYGYENHVFEIIEECSIELLNERERYYQDKYEVITQKGLNCILTETNNKSRILSKETLLKKRNCMLGKKNNLGNKHSEKSKLQMSNSHKGKKISKELKEKLLLANLGRKMPENVKKSLDWTGKKHSEESKLKMRLQKCKIILDLQTGVYYYGVIDLSNILRINSNNLYKNIKTNNQYLIT